MKKIKKLYKKYEEIINYLVIGVLTTVVTLIAYYICVYTFLDPNKTIELQIANVLSWVVGVTFAYITNRKIVFKSNEKNIKKELSKFIIGRLTTLFTDMLFMFITVSTLNLNDKIMKIISNIIVIILNYIISKFMIFKRKKD